MSESYVAAQAKEYGTYVAKETIFFDGARAFNAGDPVPASHVEQYGYDKDGLVEKVKQPASPAASNTEKKD